MISLLISRLVIVVFGFLYPAFSSYKAIKTKDIRLYVKWMMYWIVFALFMSLETFTDIFFSFWFPFYYELKIILVFWLLSPVTRGSSIMYRRVIHPLFMRREQEIDELIARAKDQGYNVILEFGCKGVSLATNAIVNTAVKGSSGLLFQLKKSYSLNDLLNAEVIDRVNELKRQSRNEYNRINITTPLIKSDTTIFNEDDAVTNVNSRPVIRPLKSSCDNIAVESTLQTDIKNVKKSRQKRQEESKHTAMSVNTTPFSCRKQFNPSPPRLYSSIPTPHIHELVVPSRVESNQIIVDRSNNVRLVEHRQSGETTAKHSVAKLTNTSVLNVVPRKAVSTPDLSLKNENFWLGDRSKNLQCVDECPLNDTVKCNDSSPSIRRRRRRKRAAPKPPESYFESDQDPNAWENGTGHCGLKIPYIHIDESKMASNSIRSRNFDGRYLNPSTRHESNKYSKPKVRSQSSKLRQFLSKSRELLIHWKNGEQTDDSQSTPSHSDYVAASSDDSYSTTSSRRNSTIL